MKNYVMEFIIYRDFDDIIDELAPILNKHNILIEGHKSDPGTLQSETVFIRMENIEDSYSLVPLERELKETLKKEFEDDVKFDENSTFIEELTSSNNEDDTQIDT